MNFDLNDYFNYEAMMKKDWLEQFVNPNRTDTKQEFPYSYDEFFVFGSRGIISENDVCGEYSDRMSQHNTALFIECVNANPDYRRDKKSASAFLTQYYGKPCKCVALAEGCNSSTGYSYWVFWWKETE